MKLSQCLRCVSTRYAMHLIARRSSRNGLSTIHWSTTVHTSSRLVDRPSKLRPSALYRNCTYNFANYRPHQQTCCVTFSGRVGRDRPFKGDRDGKKTGKMESESETCQKSLPKIALVESKVTAISYGYSRG